MAAFLERFTSFESELEQEIEALLLKLATEKASQDDIQRLYDLQQQRVDLMRPSVSNWPGQEAAAGAAPSALAAFRP